MARKLIKKEDVNKLGKTELEILQSFFPSGKDITLREVMKKTGYSYEPVYRTLKELANQKFIDVKKFGKTLVYSLDFRKEPSRVAFYLYAREKSNNFREKHFAVVSALSGLSEEKIDILAVFGSYAKGIERKDSDIDVICATAEVEELKNEILSLKRSHNLDFAPIVVPKKEFAKIKKENPEFWSDLVDHGIIFNGYELFYYYAYLT